MSGKKPKLSEVVRYFRHVYDDVEGSVSAAAKFIGGKVDVNTNHLADERRRFKNLCAIRLILCVK